MTAIVEWAPIKLAKGMTEQELLNASATFQRDFLADQPGFVSRELIRKGDGEYVDIIHWRSEADVKAIMAKVEGSQACAAYFSVMDMSEGSGSVDLYTSLAVYK